MLALTLEELLAFTDEERGRWRTWLTANPAAMNLRLQPEGRFGTVAALIDHIFLVEARHLARLRGEQVPSASGINEGDSDALFAYAAHVRDAVRAYTRSLDDVDAQKARDFTVQSGTFRMTPRKLLLHIPLHEIRHWAQIAMCVRQAGLAPPGNHDLFYSKTID